MIWPFYNRNHAVYWLRIFGWYALAEAGIQLVFYVILNQFGQRPISNLCFHTVMWAFQCLLIWPIWWVAYSASKYKIPWQIFINALFFLVYSYLWFGPAQKAIMVIYEVFQQWALPPDRHLAAMADNLDNLSYAAYQLLKHTFRLSWFFLADYGYRYRTEEAQKLALAVANRDLQIKLLKWQLNPGFYASTMQYLQQLASRNAVACAKPILQLARVMEYVIYESREKLNDISREANFLKHYTDLINQQSATGNLIEWHCGPLPPHGKIAPLLLAGLIDKAASLACVQISGPVKCDLYECQAHICFTIHHPCMGNGLSLLNEHDPLYDRLCQLYGHQFEWQEGNENNTATLRLPSGIPAGVYSAYAAG